MDMDAARFESLLNEGFALDLGEGGQVDIELLEVSRGRPAPGYEHFSLLFRAPAETPAEQRTYYIEHPATGQMAIFLVPIGSTPEGLLLEAVFNRLTNEEVAGGER